MLSTSCNGHGSINILLIKATTLALKQNCVTAAGDTDSTSSKLRSKRFEVPRGLLTHVIAGDTCRSPVAKDRTVCFTAETCAYECSRDRRALLWMFVGFWFDWFLLYEARMDAA
jgi:hypothetical protein